MNEKGCGELFSKRERTLAISSIVNFDEVGTVQALGGLLEYIFSISTSRSSTYDR
jgi:hypothetical protein